MSSDEPKTYEELSAEYDAICEASRQPPSTARTRIVKRSLHPNVKYYASSSSDSENGEAADRALNNEDAANTAEASTLKGGWWAVARDYCVVM